MAESGLNYIISVQLEKLNELQKLHDTIAAIQALSNKGAEFNVRVNSQSLDSLQKDIADSVSKGFSRAGGSVSGRSVSVDTSKLEASIAKLAEVVGGMGRGGGSVVAPVASAGSRLSGGAQRTQAALRELDAAVKLFDDVIAKKVEVTKEVAQRLTRAAGRTDLTAGESAIREELIARRERFAERAAKYSATGSQSTMGISIDASVLSRAFETGARQLGDAMRRSIEEATTGLSQAITRSVIEGLGRAPGYRPVSESDAEHAVKVLGPHMTPDQLQTMQAELYQNPAGSKAGAARRASQYLAGASNRDASLTIEAAAAGVMALPPEYRSLLTRRAVGSGEAKRLEEQIADLIKRRGQATDAIAAASSPDERASYEKAKTAIEKRIADLQIQQSGAINAVINKQISSAALQYEATLKTRRDKDLIGPDEYERKTGALRQSMQRIASLDANNPNIKREMLLLPDALAQYVRDTLNNYLGQLKQLSATGRPIDPELLQEISTNPLLANLAGGKPQNEKQVRGAIYGVQQTLSRFGSAKTAYEFIKRRAQLGLPSFNPNLDVSTAPFLDGERDVGTREQREGYLRSFLSRGGAFAAQTEERRDFASKELDKMYKQQAAGQLTEAGQRRLLEYAREVEFGGRYYYQNSPMARSTIMSNGVLMSPQEASRVREGGVRSAVMGNPLGASEAQISSEAKAARDLYAAMTYVEGALEKVNKSLSELSKLSFDPIIKEFQRLGEVLKPYAETLAKVQTSLGGSQGIQKAVSKVAEAEQVSAARQKAIEGAKTAAMLERAQLGLGPQVPIPTMPQLVGTNTLPFSTEPGQLRAATLRAYRQATGLQGRIYDQDALVNAQVAAGLPADGTQRSLRRSLTQYDAAMSVFATNALEVSNSDPRFFGKNTGAVRSAAQSLLGNEAQRRELMDNLKALTDAEATIKRIEIELAKLGNADTEAAKARRDKLQALKGQVEQFKGQTVGDLVKKGVLEASDTKPLDTLAAKYAAVNKPVAELQARLRDVAKTSIEAANAGGSFLERVASKFQNLAAYVTAGGVVYATANALRGAVTQAAGLESDIRRIQGVLPSRSAGQAGAIGEGIIQGAMDYGTSLRESVQAGKLFAQTGASPKATIELTRASLAAQVGAGMDAGQASELLIAVENITNRQVKSFDILDRISRIEAQYAVTAQDLSTAIQRAGSLATQLQPQALGAVDALDLIIGSATTIIERTRVTGDQAATSLRFIISRLGAPEVGRALQSRFGIKLAGDSPNELRPLQDILKDIADKYNQLKASGQTVQAQQLLTTFAGARQSNVAAALLSGFDDALKTASQSALAFGDTQERVRLQLDTVQARFAQFNTAFVAFASSVMNDTGLFGLTKLLLRAGTGILTAGQTVPGGFLAGAGLLAGGYALRQGSLSLMDIATRPGVGLTASTAARYGTTAAGGLASGFTTAGIALAVIAAVELIGKGLTQYFERQDIRTAERFNEQEFRKSEFFQSYNERAMRFGMSPTALAEATRAALDKASTQVQAEVASGKLPMNQSYNRTLQLLLSDTEKGLDKVVPGFLSLGDQATRTAEALSLLRDSARYGMAVPQTYGNEFVMDLNNLFKDYDKNAGMLLRALQNASTPDARGPGAGFPGGGQVVRRGNFDLQRFDSAFPGLSVSQLDAVGVGGTLRQLAQRGGEGNELRTLDNYAKTFLYVGATQRARIESIEASIRAQNPDVTITPDLFGQRMRSLKSMSVTEQGELSEAYTRLGNQRAMAGQIIQQLQPLLGNQNNARLSAMARELNPDRATPGEYFAEAIKQAIQTARDQIEKQFREGAIDMAGLRRLNEELNRLNSSAGRAATTANLMVTSVTVRDRMFEPILNYAMSMSEIGTQERLSQRFGLGFDSVTAKSQAAKTFLTQLDQVPVRILGDQIKAAASIVAGGTGTLQREAVVSEEGGPVPTTPGQRGAALSNEQMLAGFLLNRETDIRKVQAFANQYRMATTEGMGGFVDAGLRSNNAELRSTAELMKTGLEQLATYGPNETGERLQAMLRLEGDLNRQREQAIRILEADIRAETDRTNLIARLSRESEAARSEIQISFAQQQTVLGAVLQYQQANPRMAASALDTQRRLLTLNEQARVADADRTYRDTIAMTLAKVNGDRNSLEYQNAEAEAANKRDIARRTAAAERFNADYSLVSGVNTQLQRRRVDESAQLVQELTNPLRSFLMSSRNFSREGYQQLIGGVGQAAQQRLVDMFMRQMFSETGMLGDKLIAAFNTGALSTETAIERGFRLGVANLERSMAQLGVGGTLTSGGALGTGTFNVGGVQVTNGMVDLGNGQQMPLSQVANADFVGTATRSSFNWKGAANSALPLAGSLAGSQLGNPAKSYSGEGAAMGAMIGNIIAPGIGGFLGGLAGGALGGLLGKKQPEPERQTAALEKIEANTRQQIQAIENQTKMLTLDSRFLNVPTGFAVPSFRPFGVGGSAVSNAVTINVYGAPGQREDVIADQVAAALRTQLRGYGTAFDVRS